MFTIAGGIILGIFGFMAICVLIGAFFSFLKVLLSWVAQRIARRNHIQREAELQAGAQALEENKKNWLQSAEYRGLYANWVAKTPLDWGEFVKMRIPNRAEVARYERGR